MANVPGTINDDTLTGTESADVFIGSGGSDSIVGTTFSNSFNAISYTDFTAANPVTVTFTSSTGGTAIKSGIGTDTFTGIRSIRGSQGNDSLAGFAGATNSVTLQGGAGADTISGAFNSNNRADYGNAQAGVNVDLAAGTATDGLGSTDTLLNVLRVRGSRFDDTITGSAGSDLFDVSFGNDTYEGGAGFNQLEFSTATLSGPIAVTYGSSGYSGTVVKSGTDGTDSFSNVHAIYATAGADTLIGTDDATPNFPFAVVLRGRAGDDFIDGRKRQINQVTYNDSPNGVIIQLQTSTDGSGNWFGTASDGFQVLGQPAGTFSTDTLKNVNRVQGSPFSDTITGSAGSDRFDASAGNDIYFGGGGNNLADYGNQGASAPIQVTVLASETGLFGWGNATVVKGLGRGTDSLNGVNQIRGTAGNDSMAGFNHTYTWNTIVLRGGAGNDTINGVSNGSNRADYANASSAAVIDLGAGTAQDGLGGTDVLINVRAVSSSGFNDTITGSAFNDSIQVQAGGSQFVDGRGGRNSITYTGSDGATIDLGNVLAAPGGFGGWQGSIIKSAGTATIWNFNNATGGPGSDTVLGTPDDDSLAGGPGNNQLDGRGGVNTVTYRAWTGPQPTQGAVIDLVAGTATNPWGGTDSLLNIRNATGSQFSDTITSGDLGGGVFSFLSGEGGNDLLQANAGAVIASYVSSLSRVQVDLAAQRAFDDGWFGGTDTLVGIRSVVGSRFSDDLSGADTDDTLQGGNGNDNLAGRGGADVLQGGNGNDFLDGGAGNDVLDGSDGYDRADYRSAPAGIVVDMSLGRALQDGNGGTDTLVGIERVIGSDFDDSILGSAAADDFSGELGNDTLDGAGGFDVVWFGRAPGAMVVDLAAGTAAGEGADVLVSIEGAIGSTFSDDLRGDDANNYFRGDADATMAGAADTIDGRGGFDYLDYREDPVGILANLALGEVVDGRGHTDRLISIERLGGTVFADTLLGDAGANILDGRSGDDSLDGGDGDDTLAGGGGVDTFVGGAGHDQLSFLFVAGATPPPFRGAVADLSTGIIADDGFGNAELLGPGSSIEALFGTSFADTLTGASLPGGEISILSGEGGNDLLRAPNPGAAVMASYASSGTAVRADLQAGSAFDVGFPAIADTLIDIRALRGSNHADDLAGAATADTLEGGNGDDTLSGRDGTDSLAGGDGNDIAQGGGGADTMLGGNGGDTFDLQPLSDVLDVVDWSVLAAMDVVLDFDAVQGDKLAISPGDGHYRGLLTSHPVTFAGSLAAVAAPALGLALPGQPDSLISYSAFWLPDLAGGGWVVVDVDQDRVLSATDLVARINGGPGLTLTALDFIPGTFVAAAPAIAPPGQPVFGDGGVNLLLGLAGNDTIHGLAGNDALQGGAGADWLIGGLGDDSYQVDTQADLVFENPGEGEDVVVATTGFYLYAHIENLILAAGAGEIFGVGNELANGIAGNDSPNTIISWDGNDTVLGRGGNDILYSVAGEDEVDGGSGIDFLAGGDGNDTLLGNLDPDQLFGEAGDDSLVGGPDFVFDLLVGGEGADTLDGRSGNGDFDYLYGEGGNDLFMVDTPFDLVFEFAGGGADTVQADIVGAGYYLYAEIEDLVLLGVTPFGVGNELANGLTGSAEGNWLLGGAGDDTLNGKGGNDVLFGEAGADSFVFERGTGVETIGDFVSGEDRIVLSGLGFADVAEALAAFSVAPGALSGVLALGAGDFVIFDRVTSIAAADIVLV